MTRGEQYVCVVIIYNPGSGKEAGQDLCFMLLTRIDFVQTTQHRIRRDNLKNRLLNLSTADALGGGALSDVTCGTDGCSTEGDENRACVPIAIPVEDTSFVPRTCLMFVRTQEATDRKCKNGKCCFWFRF